MASGGWIQIAGEFPPKLVTNNASRLLEMGNTPNCTGIDPTAEGYMKTSSIPTVDARTVRQFTVGGNVYDWYYGRMWRASTNQVIWGAPNYTDVYLAQGAGYQDLNQSTASILKILPLGEKDLAFMRTTGTNIFVNANDTRARWFEGDFMQEVQIAAATHAVELDGNIYYVNADGFYMLKPSGEVVDIGFDVSGTIIPAAVTADYNKKLIRIGATHVYDVKKEKMFKYSGTTFVYETMEYQLDNNSTAVTDVEFHYDKTTTANVELKFQTQIEDRGYGLVETISIDAQGRGTEQSAEKSLNPDTGKTFQLKITSLPSTIKLTSIWIFVEGYVPESRDS